MEQLLADRRDRAARGADDGVIPFHELPLDRPIAALHGEMRHKKRKFLFDRADAAVEFIQVKFRQEGQHTLLHRADVLAGGVEDM